MIQCDTIKLNNNKMELKMATKIETNNLIDISNDNIDKISMVLTFYETFPYCLLVAAKNSLTEEKFEELYFVSLKNNNAFANFKTASLKTIEGQEKFIQKAQNVLGEFADYIDIEKLYLYFREQMISAKKVAKNQQKLKVPTDDMINRYNQLINYINDRLEGISKEKKEPLPNIYYMRVEGNVFSTEKIVDKDSLKEKQKIINLIGNDYYLRDYEDAINNVQLKRSLAPMFKSAIGKNKNYVNNMLNNEIVEYYMDIDKLKEMLLNYKLDELKQFMIGEIQFDNFEDKIKEFYKTYTTAEKLINEKKEKGIPLSKTESKIRDNCLYFFAHRNIENASRIIFTKDNEIASFRDKLFKEKIWGTNEIMSGFINSNVEIDALKNFIDEMKNKNIDINLQYLKYDEKKHANNFVQMYYNELSNIVDGFSSRVSKDNVYYKILNLRERYYNKLYTEKIKQMSESEAQDFAEQFGFYLYDIDGNILENNIEGTKFVYKKGYLDYNSAREFYGCDNKDPRDKNDIMQIIEKEKLARTEDKRNFSDPVVLSEQFKMYKETNGKRGLSGKKIIDMYIDNSINDETIKEFLSDEINNKDMSKEEIKEDINKMFNAEKLGLMLKYAENSKDDVDIDKYNKYKVLFNEYSNDDAKKDFIRFLKSQKIDYRKTDETITKYRLGVLSAKDINEKYEELEKKMNLSSSKNIENQLDETDKVVAKMIREQTILKDRDIKTIFLDGSLDVDAKKKRLARIFEKNSDKTSTNFINYQQRFNTIIKIEPPENEYFTPYLELDNYAPRHGKSIANVSKENDPNELKESAEKEHKNQKEFYDRKHFLESLDEDVKSYIFGDIVIFELPNKGKVIFEQSKIRTSEDNQSMKYTDKATYILNKEFFDKMKNKPVQDSRENNENEYSLIYTDRDDNKRIDWKLLSSFREYTRDVKRAIHKYQNDSWERSILRTLGYGNKETNEILKSLNVKDDKIEEHN